MKRFAALAAGVALLAGCGYDGASSLPLPGAIGGGDTYRVVVILDDATNLVAKETCRTNDTVVGSVESVELTKDLRARVVCRIKNSVELPANAVARLGETSLLGERYVALDPPAGVEAAGVLSPGTTLPAATTRTDPNVEMVFGALSQVLNGGGLGALETITRELESALSGSDLGATLEEVDGLVSAFNGHRDEIAASLVSLDRLAGTLAKQRGVLEDALDSVPGGLAVLERQRTRLVGTLQRLSALSRTAVPLLSATRANTVADLKHLAPVLNQLNKAGDELALTLGRVVTFPFPSTVLSTVKGDFAGMYATFDLDIDLLNRILGLTKFPASEPAEKPTTVRPTKPVDPVQQALEPVTGAIADLLNGLLGGGR